MATTTIHLRDQCERFFRPGYNESLLTAWLPALGGVVETLQRGARVADVGCGQGSSTLLMAAAFPRSTFRGFDVHDARAFEGTSYALVVTFDCLHESGDPVAEARHVLAALAPGGTWMLVDPLPGWGDADAAEARIRAIAAAAGFGHVRRAAETPYNAVFEIRAGS